MTTSTIRNRNTRADYARACWQFFEWCGGKEHDMPVHHLRERILDEYIVGAGIQSGQPLFQSVNSTGMEVTGHALNRYNAWAAIRKRAKAAAFLTPVGSHTWRATGITIYLENDGRLDGRLEHAQQMAGHESPRTTKLYDRTKRRLHYARQSESGCDM